MACAAVQVKLGLGGAELCEKVTVQQVLRHMDPIGRIACHTLLGGLLLLGFLVNYCSLSA